MNEKDKKLREQQKITELKIEFQVPTISLVPPEWINKHLSKFNQAKYDAQGMEIIKDNKHISTLKSTVAKKDLKTIITSHIKKE